MDYFSKNQRWLLENQTMLARIYREEKYNRYIQKNRAEKLRARIRNNIPPSRWKQEKRVDP
jgi:hypothetical protein